METVVAGLGEVPEMVPQVMVVLYTSCSSVMRTREGSLDGVGDSLFG